MEHFTKNFLIDFVFDGCYDFQMAQILEQNKMKITKFHGSLCVCACLLDTIRINFVLLVPLLMSSMFVISGLDYERKIKRVE